MARAIDNDAEGQGGQAGTRILRVIVPLMVGAVMLGLWEAMVRINETPAYILPAPSAILVTLVQEWSSLLPSLLVTLQITWLALAVAIIGGAGLAVLFSLSRWVEMALFPYAVIVQVTPVVAIAPLIMIYVDNTLLAVVIVAWIVAFFPILSNTTTGLNSADHNLHNLFELYGASRWQTLRYLRMPAAMPFFLAGLRIAGGLSLIGAVVAEYVAGTAGTGTGLAYRILEAGYRLQIPKMFAALFLLALTGIAIFLFFSAISHFALRRWHESAVRREN